MNYTVPLRSLTDGVFGYDQHDRYTVVLKAFFDDSGTHGKSDAVVMAGLIADESAWVALEIEWAEALAEFGLRKMHMAHCENRHGQFKDMERPERDRIIARFSGIIQKLNARILVAAVSRHIWNTVASISRLGEVFPDPIDYCFNACMRHAMETRRASGVVREPVVVTFDSREQNINYWKHLAKGYEELWPDRVAGFAFSSMEKVRPLQAADMIAYEAFVFQCERQRNGAAPTPRENLTKLTDALPIHGGFFTEQNLRDYASELEAALPPRSA